MSKLFSTSFADQSKNQSAFIECRQGRQAGPCPRGNLWSGSDKHFGCFKITLTCVFVKMIGKV